MPGAVLEAYRRGRAAVPMERMEWEVLLDQPVAALRERFRIGPAPRYEATLATIRRQQATEGVSS